MMKTYAPKPRDIERRWYVIDADGAVLGRLASEVAKILRGKHKPIFAPHADTGDHVIVVNARKVRLTGGKEQKKVAYRHSGYPGGLRAIGYDRLLAERPATAVEKAVRGMLPKNRLGRSILRKLAVYEGPDHPHAAQKPVALALGEVPSWSGLPSPEAVAAPPPRPRRRPKPVEEPAPATTPEERPAPKRSTAKRSGTGTAAKRSATKTAAKRSTAKTPARATAKRSTAKRSAKSGETKEAPRKATRRRRTKREEES